MDESYRVNDVIGKITQSIVLGYQTIAVVVFAISLFLASGWINTPFIGGFFEQTMVLNGTDSYEAGRHWALYTEGFKIGDQLVSVNGQPVSSSQELERALDDLQVGQNVSVVMRTSDGERNATITLQPFPGADRISYFGIPAFLSFVFLGISLWIFGLRRTELAGRAFSVMTTSLAIVIGSLFDLYTTHWFTYIWTLAAALSGGALIDLALCFPQEAGFMVRRPYLRWFGYVIGIGLAVSAYFKLYDFQNPIAYFDSWRAIYIFIGISGLFYFSALGFHAFFSYSPVVKSSGKNDSFWSVGGV